MRTNISAIDCDMDGGFGQEKETFLKSKMVCSMLILVNNWAI